MRVWRELGAAGGAGSTYQAVSAVGASLKGDESALEQSRCTGPQAAAFAPPPQSGHKVGVRKCTKEMAS